MKIAAFLLGALMLMPSALDAQSAFKHPGLLHSEADFARMKQRIEDGEEAAVQSLANMQGSFAIRGDHGHGWAVNEEITRGIAGHQNYINAYRNASRAYQMAMIWKLTGDIGAANEAVGILNSYALYNKSLGGNTNISLIPAFTGYHFLNAAEIVRDYEGWNKEDFDRFKQYMVDVWFTVAQDFLERRHDTVAKEGNWIHYYSNWGVGNALFCISLGIFADMPDVYNYGMYWLTEGPGCESLFIGEHPYPNAGVMSGEGWGLIPWFHPDDRAPLGYFGQMQESGRDQGHSLASLGLLGTALETLYKQDNNVYCNLYNPIVEGLAGSAIVAGAAEYVAAYNTGSDDLPWKNNWWMTGFNANSRGQWRPIWQQFINAYENRMGIQMPYSHKAHDAMGLEWGSGDYGAGSGSYDHIGWGDLCHNDEPVAPGMAPTVLYPVITINGSETHHVGFASKIAKGAGVTLTANLQKGESNTGNWIWDDGTTGQTRTITATKSGLYTVTYTNSKGVKSRQSFSLAVYGEGVTGTLKHDFTKHNEVTTLTDDATLLVGLGTTATLRSIYTNWNFIEKEEWFENDALIATGGLLSYTLNDSNDHTIVYRLTTESGAVVERTFTIQRDINDLTNLLADPHCNDLSKWTKTGATMQIGPNAQYNRFAWPFIETFRFASQDDKNGWGLGTFDIKSSVSGLAPGKYRLSANIIATQQSGLDNGQKGVVGGYYLYAGGAMVPVSSLNGAPETFAVYFYVGSDGKMTYGVKNVADQNYAESFMGANWFAMDEFDMMSLGNDDLAADLENLTNRGNAIAEDMVPAYIYNKVQTALGMAEDNVDKMVALQTAVCEAEAAATYYKAYVQESNCLQDALTRSGYSNATLTTAIANLTGAQSIEQMHAAHKAMTDAWKSAITSINTYQDVSFLVNNMNLSHSTPNWYDNSLHWKTECLTGNMRVFDYNGVTTLERKCDGNFSAGERVLYQTVSGLPRGYYTLSVKALQGSRFGRVALYARSATESRDTLQNERSVDPYNVGVYVEDGTLDLGLLSLEDNRTDWAFMQDIHLTYYASARTLLAELCAEAQAQVDNGGTNLLKNTLTKAKNDLSTSASEATLAQDIDALRYAMNYVETLDYNFAVNGWQKITTAEAMDAAVADGDVFVLRDNHGFMMDLVSLDNGRKKMMFSEIADPLSHPSMVWTIENGSVEGKLGIRNITYSCLLMQTEWNAGWEINTHDQPVAISWADMNFALDDKGSWTIENGTYPATSNNGYGYFGPWDPYFAAGQHVAGNKQEDLASHFDIYSMSRADYYKKYIKEESRDLTKFLANPSFETGNAWGWYTEGNGFTVHALDNLDGKDGTFYAQWWLGSGTMWEGRVTQNVKGLPKGRYEITALAGGAAHMDFYVMKDGVNIAATGLFFDEAKIDRTLAFDITEDGTEVLIGYYHNKQGANRWVAVDNFRLKYVGGIVNIVNPSFEDGLNGWTFDQPQGGDYGVKDNSGIYFTSNADGAHVLNVWDKGAPVTQVLEDLEPGVYKLSATLASSELNGYEPSVYLMANGKTAGVSVDKNGNVGVVGHIYFKVGNSGESVVIGVVGCDKNNGYTYTEDLDDMFWYKADNFQITMVGDEMLQDDVDELNSAIETVPTTGMDKKFLAELTAAKNAWVENPSVDNYNTLKFLISRSNIEVRKRTDLLNSLRIGIVARLLNALQNSTVNDTMDYNQDDKVNMDDVDFVRDVILKRK